MYKKYLSQIMFNADGNTGGEGTGEVNTNSETNTDVNGTNTNDATETKPLSLEDVQKMIQSETDKVRGEYSKKLKDKDAELEDIRKSTMTDAEIKAEEKKKLEESLSKRETELLHKELTLDTIDMLKQSDLPIEFKDFLIGKDADATKSNVESFNKVFKEQLEIMVKERFKGTGKDHNEGSGQTGRYTQDDIAKMSPNEINANWEKIQRDLSGN